MPKITKKKSKDPAAGKHIYTGKLEVTRSGMGFVVVPELETDIIVDRYSMDNALNGDEVRVEVRGHNDGNKRLKGEIMEVDRKSVV